MGDRLCFDSAAVAPFQRGWRRFISDISRALIRPSMWPKLAEPAFVKPMAAQLVDKLPEAQAWLYELKFDGYRALVIKGGANVRVLSRNRKDLTRIYPTVVVGGSLP